MSQEDRQVELRERTDQLLRGRLKHVRTAGLAASLVPLAVVALAPIVAQGQFSGGAPIQLVDVTNNPGAFQSPVGIDCQATSAKLVTSANAGSGLPHNFDLIDPVTGQVVQFSSVVGAQGGIKVASIHTSTNQGGFIAGDVYAGNGVAGQILKISANGSVVTNPWVTLPGETALVTGLFQDRYGVAAGDLIVVTGNPQNGSASDFVGNVWRITSGGTPMLLRSLGKHLEGVTTAPNDALKYGPIAGQILVGDEDRLVSPERDGSQCKIIAINPTSGLISATISTEPAIPPGGSTPPNYHVNSALCPEDLDIVFGDGPLYGVDASNNRILTAPASDFAGFDGDLLVTKELPTGDASVPSPGGTSDSGLRIVHWDDAIQQLTVTSLTTTLTIDRWKDVTFAGPTACAAPAAETPGVSLTKFTNGADANDPNGAGVPTIAPGDPVTWTYRVTNTGNTNVARADVAVSDDTAGVRPTFTSVISGNGDTIFDPGEVWLYTATGTALNLALPPPAGVHTAPNSCTAAGTQPARTAYTNVGTVTIPGANASDSSSYCNPPPPSVLPCPSGSFTYAVDAAGNLNIVYDQFPAPNDNSYGVNAVGWGTKGHTFSNLVGSDHAGFQLVNPSGVVKLDFAIDYITAKSGAPSGYASLGATGGDGSINIAADGLGAAGITGDSSLARNLNTLGYFVGGAQVASTKTDPNGTDLLVNSPKTINTTDDYTLVTPNPWVNGWDFHDTYYVTISAARLASLGFDASTWKVQPNADELHNSPAKACPTAGGGGSCNLSIPLKKTQGKEVQITITNGATVDSVLTALSLTWPAANGKLMQIKLDGDVVYDKPDIAPPTANLTAAQLVGDQKKRTIQKNSSDVLHLVFEKNVDTNLSRYSGALTFGDCVLVILP